MHAQLLYGHTGSQDFFTCHMSVTTVTLNYVMLYSKAWGPVKNYKMVRIRRNLSKSKLFFLEKNHVHLSSQNRELYIKFVDMNIMDKAQNARNHVRLWLKSTIETNRYRITS